MAREKMTPEQTGEREYEQRRSYLSARIGDRELMQWLARDRRVVAQRDHLNKYRSAPHGEAKERARLRATLDEIRSRRHSTETTIAGLFAQMTGPAPAEPVYPLVFTESSNA